MKIHMKTQQTETLFGGSRLVLHFLNIGRVIGLPQVRLHTRVALASLPEASGIPAINIHNPKPQNLYKS